MAEQKQKMVKVKIPRTRKDQEDVLVYLNMKPYTINRGVEVEVPEGVAEILKHQEEMLEKIMQFEEDNAR